MNTSISGLPDMPIINKAKGKRQKAKEDRQKAKEDSQNQEGGEKRWRIIDRDQTDIINQLLKNRGVKGKDKEVFLDPQYERDLHDPFLMKGMHEAVERLHQAIEARERIGIFGDYDADGIPATALLYGVLRDLGLSVDVYIPSREEGYGLNEKGIRSFKESGVTLIISVDTGIAAAKEISLARDLGLETIVTDHHEVQESCFPDKAVAVIDPKQKDCTYPFKELSGTAVAFKLISALAKRYKLISDNELKWMLDLVAISTFCDMVPLVGENRILAKFGLIVLAKTRRLGLRQLCLASSINLADVSPYVVSFLIGPRINAPGRLGNVNTAFQLLISEDEKEAYAMATRLDQINKERQELTQRVLQEAEGKVRQGNLHKKKVIVVDGEGWPEGIIGLVAGKLTEKYARPSIVIGRREGESRGSARSVEGFHLVEALGECKEYLVKHGGHAKAAGLTVATEHMENLYDRILEVAEEKLSGDDLKPLVTCDIEIGLADVTWDLYEQLYQLEPFGLGNPRPVFISRNVIVKTVGVVGNGGKHLKCSFRYDGSKTEYRSIGFDMGSRAEACQEGNAVDIVYTIDEDAWRGGKTIQLKLLDFCRTGNT